MKFYIYNCDCPFPVDRMHVYIFFSEGSASHIQAIPEITFIIVFLYFVIMKLEQQRAFSQVISLAKLVISSLMTKMLMDNTGSALQNFASLPHIFFFNDFSSVDILFTCVQALF